MDDILNKVEKLRPVAAKFNVPMSQLAISWCAKNPNVSSDQYADFVQWSRALNCL
jgi:aryl-alcohol dehydrogenase-like predicted oxidoreductase